MPIKKIILKVNPIDEGKRLDHFLHESFLLNQYPLSRTKIRTLILAGAIHLNGKRTISPSKIISYPLKIDAYLDENKILSSQKDQEFSMNSNHVLYEDEWIVLVNKPPGLPTQPTLDEARNNLFESVKKYYNQHHEKELKSKEDHSYVGLHHRLDKDTSGVILFTRSKKANFNISELFKNHQINKTYVAICWNPNQKKCQQSWEVKNYLGKINKMGKQNRFGSVKSGGDFAHTQFKLISQTTSKDFLLIEAKPLTGRTHQIRVHLAEQGFPIINDKTYGFNIDAIREELKNQIASRIFLHAQQLSFLHPITQIPMNISCPTPYDFLKALKNLSLGLEK